MSNLIIATLVILLSLLSSAMTWLIINSFREVFTTQAENTPLLIILFVSGIFFLVFALIGVCVSYERHHRILLQQIKEAEKLTESYRKQILATVKVVLDELALGILLCDEKMHIEWINTAACRISGFDDRESVPEDFILGVSLLVENDKNEAINIYSSHDSFQPQEAMVHQPESQPCPVLITKTSRVIADTPYHIFTMLDMGELKTLQADLTNMRKMASIGQLASTITHKFNTPSQFVIPNLDFMLAAVQDVFRIFDTLNTILADTDLSNSAGKISNKKQLVEALNDPELKYLRTELPVATKQTREGIREIVEIVREIKQSTQPFRIDTVQAVDINSTIQALIEVTGAKWSNTVDFNLNLSPDIYQIVSNVNDVNKAMYYCLEERIKCVRKNMKNSIITGKGVVNIRTGNHKKCIEISIEDNGARDCSDIHHERTIQSDKTEPIADTLSNELAFAEKIFCKNLKGTLSVTSLSKTKTHLLIRVPVKS